MNHLLNLLNDFTPISLEEMDRVKLQNRIDTKFVFNSAYLPKILQEIEPFYAVLEINNLRYNSYKTLYFDTDKFQNFYNHHNGKLNRIKVRFRNYIESQLHFLEVKFKSNKGRTIKYRTLVNKIEDTLSKSSMAFINKNAINQQINLTPKLWNNFTRITLVNKKVNERITIDYHLIFELFDISKSINLEHTAIIEVKRSKSTGKSEFLKTLKKYHIRNSSMSKYCVGVTLLLKNQLKQNNFKENILTIKKIENGSKLLA